MSRHGKDIRDRFYNWFRDPAQGRSYDQICNGVDHRVSHKILDPVWIRVRDLIRQHTKQEIS